ncbi:MAG: helix-turn-helix domain-containing protein [Firmicutes bacterium]|nr:helix-turn-helix domain-containing protein [Bacillota bacterium]
MTKQTFIAVTSAIEQDNRLTWFEKHLYSAVCNLTNQNGYCFARNEYLAERFGVSKNHVSRVISKLAKLGFVKVVLDPKCNRGHVRKIFIDNLQEVTVTAGVVLEDCIPQELETPSQRIIPITKDGNTPNQFELPLYKDVKTKANTEVKKESGKPPPHTFEPPKFEEVLNFAKLHDAEFLARKFFDHYTLGDDQTKHWRDTYGKRFTNWQQKFLTWKNRERPNKILPPNAQGLGKYVPDGGINYDNG